MDLAALSAALLFAAIFLGGWKVHPLFSQRAALSIGAGVSTAYVFIQMLPELSEAGAVFVEDTAGRALPMPELRVYGAALLGFLVFYGIEHLVLWSHAHASPGGHESTRAVFLLQMAGFALYAWFVSYLLVREVGEHAASTGLYAVAMGLHFLGVARSLSREHGARYAGVGRFLLAGASLAGWGTGTLAELSIPVVVTGLGFVSGGVVMNSMVMELPDGRDGRFLPFVAGAVGYAALLALV